MATSIRPNSPIETPVPVSQLKIEQCQDELFQFLISPTAEKYIGTIHLFSKVLSKADGAVKLALLSEIINQALDAKALSGNIENVFLSDFIDQREFIQKVVTKLQAHVADLPPPRPLSADTIKGAENALKRYVEEPEVSLRLKNCILEVQARSDGDFMKDCVSNPGYYKFFSELVEAEGDKIHPHIREVFSHPQYNGFPLIHRCVSSAQQKIQQEGPIPSTWIRT